MWMSMLSPSTSEPQPPVPLHWQEKVEQDLNRDVALGVLERVPYGEPTKWCFRMVITRKHDGSPRRTVDLSPLNKYCEREAHPSKSPFHLARSVPQGSIKTVLDAWNGFHSVPIREEDHILQRLQLLLGSTDISGLHRATSQVAMATVDVLMISLPIS